MRYAQIRDMDITNGEGIGVALFVQGCHFRCRNCFNSSTWDFSGGQEFTDETKERLLSLLDKPYISRLSILGGEPLANENIKDVISIMREAKGVDIWLYTGYTYDKCLSDPQRKQAVQLATYVIDGQYVDELKDLTLKYRGSSNQTIRRTNETNGS